MYIKCISLAKQESIERNGVYTYIFLKGFNYV